MMLEEVVELEKSQKELEMRSFNHSYVCTELLLQLAQNKAYRPLVELTLDIENGLTPDISVYLKDKIKPNFFQDITKYPEMPTLAIEVIPASQSIQDLLNNAKLLVKHGVKAVWTVEPFSNTIFRSEERRVGKECA